MVVAGDDEFDYNLDDDDELDEGFYRIDDEEEGSEEDEELDEWEYTNCFGDSLCLMISENYGLILCDSDYAFLSLQVNFSFLDNTSGEPISRELLEKAADLVHFGTLAQELPQKTA